MILRSFFMKTHMVELGDVRKAKEYPGEVLDDLHASEFKFFIFRSLFNL